MWWWLLQHTVTAAILIAGVFTVRRLVPTKPAVHHALWAVVLLKFVLPPGLDWPWSVGSAFRGLGLESFYGPLANEDASLAEGGDDGSNVSRALGAPSVLFLAAAWLTGGVVALIWQLKRILNVRVLVASGEPAHASLTKSADALAEKLGTKRVPIIVVDGVSSPFLWCFGRLVLVWPRHLADGPLDAELRGVMAHELAHVVRRDHWIAWGALAAGILWWWNPLCRLVRRELEDAAEFACDALALDWAACNRMVYAEALLRLSALPSSPQSLALGATLRERHNFERRLRMIMNVQSAGRASATTLLLAGVVAIAAAPNWSWNGSASAAAVAEQPNPTTSLVPEPSPNPSPEPNPSPNPEPTPSPDSATAPAPDPSPDSNPLPDDEAVQEVSNESA